MALLFRTGDGSKPAGKPRVYFTCHPQDQQTCFPQVCEELFPLCNCAVYYDDPAAPSPRDAEYDERLKQMHLLVIPVTTAFLTQPNPALDHDFRFAVAHHIPVLPLVQEPGLDKLFAQKCGNLQYLDKTLRSPTAIPYEEKLRQFLSAVLLNDKTLRQIRAHFDGYVFLSYRKKDRRYIHELMRLIHSFPKFRDIALWYDEYLTPGEDFNDEIAEHLRNSHAFALIVTPNLVNEENYVQKHEYPQAIEQHKPIIPIQYEKTSSQHLRSDYPEIPDCLDPQDIAAVEAALERGLSGLRRTADTSPDHWYHIGLAYLTGTDVEVDHPRAVKLITAAAEAGLEAAMEKLTKMYRTGDGVRRDPDQVLYWTRKMVELTQIAYENSGDHTDGVIHSHQLNIAASICTSIERFDLAQEFALEALALSQELYATGKLKQGYLLDTYELLADIYSIQGYEQKAVEQLYTAYKHLHDLCKRAGNVSAVQLRKLSHYCQSIGDLYQELHHLTHAEKFYRQATEFLVTLDEDELDLPLRAKLAQLHQDLGDVCLLREDFDGAEKEYLLGLEMAKAIVSLSGNDQILISHYHALGKLGDQRPGLLSGRKYWKQALEIARQRDRRKSTDETQLDLAQCYSFLGFSYYTKWNLMLRNVIRGKARPLLEDALTIFRKLDQTQNTYTSRLRVHSALCALTELHINMDFYREAEPYCLEQLIISKYLLQQTPDPESKVRLSYDLALLSKIAKELKQTEKATHYARKRFDILVGIVEEVDTCEIWNEMAEASFELALLTRDADDMELAANIWHTLSQEYPEVPIYAQREQEAREYLP